jgi:hypothetical protein
MQGSPETRDGFEEFLMPISFFVRSTVFLDSIPGLPFGRTNQTAVTHHPARFLGEPRWRFAGSGSAPPPTLSRTRGGEGGDASQRSRFLLRTRPNDVCVFAKPLDGAENQTCVVVQGNKVGNNTNNCPSQLGSDDPVFSFLGFAFVYLDEAVC